MFIHQTVMAIKHLLSDTPFSFEQHQTTQLVTTNVTPEMQEIFECVIALLTPHIGHSDRWNRRDKTNDG